ncbi:LysR family transcriptional regulator [Chelatococcus sp. GCM10030263]|uniref:LysR family transcriptional regulator n=1 Tax=Chelatococcus sp. GCM10030263 TaxID=3273387 RepID=UPI00360A56B9
MDLRDLAYFEVIADAGNLRVAAEKLGRTKPALTKCIHRLESAIGGELFERAGRGIVLTVLGSVLLERARYLRAEVAEVRRELHDRAQGSAGHVRIGAGAVTANSLLPPVVSALLAQSPAVTLEIVVGMGDVLREALRRGEIDIIVSSVSWEQDGTFAVEVLCDDEVVVVANPRHELFRRAVDLPVLARYKWVLSRQSVANRQWLERVFLAKGLPAPVVQIETNSIQELPRLISETNLLSFTSTRGLGAPARSAPLRAIRLEETTLRRKLGFMTRRDSYVAPATRQLIAELRRHSSEAVTT